MITCTIRVSGVRYTGRFSSTCAAVIDALQRFPAATRISVSAGT